VAQNSQILIQENKNPQKNSKQPLIDKKNSLAEGKSDTNQENEAGEDSNGFASDHRL
jgi:hypothetical protein